jgi:hypothetical protein
MDKTFPCKNIDVKDSNKAVASLFGNRLYLDQTTIETLCELLVICFAETKTVTSDGNQRQYQQSIFPDINISDSFEELTYQVKYQLRLKLFSLFAFDDQSSDIAPLKSLSHRQRASVTNAMKGSNGYLNSEEYADVLMNLFAGFQIAGTNRGWCARSFFPVSINTLAPETIMTKKLRKECPRNADFEEISKNYLSTNGRYFYCRNGEVLYLQLLAAFAHSSDDVRTWQNSLPEEKRIKLDEDEFNPKYLRTELARKLRNLYENPVAKSLDIVIEQIDNSSNLSLNASKTSNDVSIGWIPERCWKEGFIFALELNRLLSCQHEMVDTIRLMELECSFQILRTQLIESAAYLNVETPLMPVVDVESDDLIAKDISNMGFSSARQLINNAVTAKMIEEYGSVHNDNEWQKYGASIFTKISKSIGFVVPPKGSGEHFVLSRDMLVLFVSTTLAPDKSLTIDSFLEELKKRFFVAITDKDFSLANANNNRKQVVSSDGFSDWFLQMLDESGYLIPLSDSLSLVKNRVSLIKK